MKSNVWDAVKQYLADDEALIRARVNYDDAIGVVEKSREVLKESIGSIGKNDTIALDLKDGRILLAHCDHDYDVSFTLIQSHVKPED